MSIRRNRTTAVDGSGAFGAPTHICEHPPRLPLRCLVRAMLELARSREQLQHVPTRAQLRDLARFDGRNPRSYRLDAGEIVDLPSGLDIAPGDYALRFTAEHGGRRRELVALPSGGGFDLMSGFE